MRAETEISWNDLVGRRVQLRWSVTVPLGMTGRVADPVRDCPGCSLVVSWVAVSSASFPAKQVGGTLPGGAW
jgi:hypothetical protein